jgi:hypothetical protein
MNAASGTAPLGTLCTERDPARALANVDGTAETLSSVILIVPDEANAPAGAATVSVCAPRLVVTDPPLVVIGAEVLVLLGVGVTVTSGGGGTELPPPQPPKMAANVDMTTPNISRCRKRPRLTTA